MIADWELDVYGHLARESVHGGVVLASSFGGEADTALEFPGVEVLSRSVTLDYLGQVHIRSIVPQLRKLRPQPPADVVRVGPAGATSVPAPEMHEREPDVAHGIKGLEVPQRQVANNGGVDDAVLGGSDSPIEHLVDNVGNSVNDVALLGASGAHRSLDYAPPYRRSIEGDKPSVRLADLDVVVGDLFDGAEVLAAGSTPASPDDAAAVGGPGLLDLESLLPPTGRTSTRAAR